jgi:hypothetical protein
MFCNLLTLQKVAGRLVYTVARVLFNKNLMALIGRLLQRQHDLDYQARSGYWFVTDG